MESAIEFNCEGEKAIKLKSCSYSLSRSTDMNGKPTQIPRAGSIAISFDISENYDGKFFPAWAASRNNPIKDGSIVIRDGSSLKQIRQIEFKKAAVTSYSESCFDGAGVQISLTIYAKELKIGDAPVVDNEPK